MTRQEVADLNGIVSSTVTKWCSRVRESGTPAAKPMGGHRPLKLEDERDWLRSRHVLTAPVCVEPSHSVFGATPACPGARGRPCAGARARTRSDARDLLYEIRFDGNQFLHRVYFVIDEEHIWNVNGCTTATRGRSPQVTRAKTQDDPEEIGAVLLKTQAVGVEALRTTADKVLFRHLPGPDSPIGQPVENEEHHQPDDEKARRKHHIEAGVHVH